MRIQNTTNPQKKKKQKQVAKPVLSAQDILGQSYLIRSVDFRILLLVASSHCLITVCTRGAT